MTVVVRAMSKINAHMGMPTMRVLTDVSAEHYWTVVSEMEVASLAAFEKMFADISQDSPEAKEVEAIMKGSHELLDYGRREIYRREIYKIEG